MPYTIGLLLFLLTAASTAAAQTIHNFAPVNGLRMYYEIHGSFPAATGRWYCCMAAAQP